MVLLPSFSTTQHAGWRLVPAECSGHFLVFTLRTQYTTPHCTPYYLIFERRRTEYM